MKNILNVLVCLIVSFNVLAESSREKDSHEHGAANVMLAMEGEKLQLNFEVPSESLIGFEHFPKSQDQRWYFNEAIKTLLEPSKLFSISANAECLLVGIKVSQSLFSDEDEHGHDEKDEHGHDEKDEHGHDESDKSEIHSEFSSKYHWNCEHLDEIDSIATQLMNIFPRIEEIRVRWITKNNQGSIELESKDDRIKGWK